MVYRALLFENFTLEYLMLNVMEFDKANVLHKHLIRTQAQDEDAEPGLRQSRSALNTIRRSRGIGALLARLMVKDKRT